MSIFVFVLLLIVDFPYVDMSSLLLKFTNCSFKSKSESLVEGLWPEVVIIDVHTLNIDVK